MVEFCVYMTYMHFVIVLLTFILVLSLLINNCFNMLFILHNYHIFYVNVEVDDFIVADQ